MTSRDRRVGRAVAVLGASVLATLCAVGCGASGDLDLPNEEASSVEEVITTACKNATPDKFVAVNTDCSGCNPGEGRYVVSSQVNGLYEGPPCSPNFILDVGGNQQKINIKTAWEDSIPTTSATCTAAKITQSYFYRGNDIGTVVANGKWANNKCTPPGLNRAFSHEIVSGLPGEFFAHLRILTDAQTAITHGKHFGVQLCRGLNGCN